jgi:hypothetical protein
MAAFARGRFTDKVVSARQRLAGGRRAETPQMRALLVVAYAKAWNIAVCHLVVRCDVLHRRWPAAHSLQ